MKISVIGSGRLGSTTAFEIINRELANEIVLVDIIQNLPQGEAMDLNQMASEKGKSIYVVGSNDYKDIEGSSVVVVTAGVARKPGMTRMDLLKTNAPIVRDVTKEIVRYAKDSIIIVVSNPMDVMTYVALKTSKFERNRVIGMGGQLDSARYREILSQMLGVSRSSVRALVIGEHGETMFPIPRFSYAGYSRVSDLLSQEKLKEAEERTRKIAAEVIALKGATVFAPISCITTLIESIVKDKKDLLPVSAYLNGEYGLKDLCLGVPAIIGRNGIEKIIELDLNEEERARFNNSAAAVRKAIDELLTLKVIE
ncbi:MAG TPA: malate dehydrogenase [Geobacterales bacterium]|nr:malate dehydrogenase [Geobacterales bacterium]